MNTWRDKLQPASFRGVPFLVETGDAEFGRRVHAVEYPYRDEPFVDDMGRRMRTYSVDAFIIDNETGSDLFTQRTALIDAIEKPGAATLIHPRLGALRVQADRGRWRSTAGGNVEKFSITFFEAADEAAPQVVTDTLDTVTVTADAAQAAQQSTFEKVLNISRQADFVVQSVRADIERGMQGVRKLVRIGTASADSVASLTQTIDRAIDDISDLILLPRTLASTVSGLVSQALGLDDQLDSVMSGYRAIGTLWGDAEPIPQTTASRITQQNNRNAITNLFQISATISAVQLVAQQASAIGVSSNANSPFDSADDAYAVRDELIAALDAIALTADDTLYSTVVELQSALVAHIDAHGNALPKVSRVVYGNPLPMLVIAHLLDGTVDREADLIARNRIRHPLNVPADRELEVLNG